MEKIFKWFTLEYDVLTTVRIDWFVQIFDTDEFNGVDAVLAHFLKYCADLNIPALKRYLDVFLETESGKVIKKNSIRIEMMDNFDYNEPASLHEAIRVINNAVSSMYEAYTNVDLTDHEFKVDVRAFMEENKIERVQKVMANAFPLLTVGGDVDDIVSNLQYELDKISLTYDIKCLEKLDFMSGTRSTTKDEANGFRFLFHTGLPCVDADQGGVYSKQLVSVTGQPGAGKTRLAAAHYAYRAAVTAKLDVLFDELELTKREVENMLIAHHIIHLYKGKIKIPDSDMNKNNLTEEQRRYYEAAKIDLFESGKYGKILIRTDDLVVETLRKDMFTMLKHNKNLQFWIIDYAGLAKSKPQGKFAKHKEEFEIIQDLYKTAKEIVKTADIGGLILNQFSEKGIQAAMAGKRIMPGHVQGGQIIQRHSDYDLAMCRTEEQELANISTLSTVKKRAAKGFQNVPYGTDLSVSIFRQMRQDATS